LYWLPLRFVGFIICFDFAMDTNVTVHGPRGGRILRLLVTVALVENSLVFRIYGFLSRIQFSLTDLHLREAILTL
jgi:hypothetical protein